MTHMLYEFPIWKNKNDLNESKELQNKSQINTQEKTEGFGDQSEDKNMISSVSNEDEAEKMEIYSNPKAESVDIRYSE